MTHSMLKFSSALSLLRRWSLASWGCMPRWCTKQGPKSCLMKLRSSAGLCPTPAPQAAPVTQTGAALKAD